MKWLKRIFISYLGVHFAILAIFTPSSVIPSVVSVLAPYAPQKPVLSQKQALQGYLMEKVLSEGLEMRDYWILKRIANCESGFSHFAKNGKVLIGRQNKADTGIFQINTYFHKARAAELNLNLFDERQNIDYAINLYKKTGLKSWSASFKCWKYIS